MRSGRNGAQQVKFLSICNLPRLGLRLLRRPSFWEHSLLTGVFLASEWSTGMPDRVSQAVKKPKPSWLAMSSLGRGTAKKRRMTCWPFSTMIGL
ncbi:hypothetical protein BST65_01275 [Bradyrhizobium canariense]|nr:hypothetical protein BST65_01275 [Bradyrhizobium canariense]OSI37249.1 hypothetical protein BST66_04185 [Bradyrhizobium canariense]OSI54895.1 hypothetical protein BSZ20_02140 [Bradyrhizobium canariense]OSI57315.1 hypothetical protein BST67_02090 [Bradyrhizobium canariense]OSI59886.1 hypothetical protein BSZ15_02450 [Bradyrhizobium canariense]